MLPHELASEEAAMAAAHDGNPVCIHHACGRQQSQVSKALTSAQAYALSVASRQRTTLGNGGVEGSKAVLDIERADAARQRLHTVLAKPQRAPDRPPKHLVTAAGVLAYHVKTHEPQQPRRRLEGRASEHTGSWVGCRHSPASPGMPLRA